MRDRYSSFANTAVGRAIVERFRLPEPVPLIRDDPAGRLTGPVRLGGGDRLREPAARVLAGADVATTAESTVDGLAALVYDATALRGSADLRGLYDFFHPSARSLRPGGRVIVLGTPPRACASPAEAAAQHALTGFVRSVGREFGRGSTAQLVQVSPDAEDMIESTLRFLLSARSAYVSGQVIHVSPGVANAPPDWARPLDGAIALVTGAARGIGAATARTLARDGATVVCLDVPSAEPDLSAVAASFGGEALALDLAAPDTPSALADHLSARYAGLDVLVHNAGILRDRTLARMTPDEWDQVLAVNLGAPERVTQCLLSAKVLRRGARVVCVSSVSGIAGNRGQANYATSKAGVIGFVEAQSRALARHSVTVNAVAPGFIETAMTATMPLLAREIGRRLNSLAQGGLPEDVAETVAWLASPASAGLTGNVVRVCGQSLIGA